MESVEGYSVALVALGEARSEVDLETLVETYAPLLFRVAYSVLRSRSEAEDAVQDAFVKVLQHRRALPAVRDMRVWMVQIVWRIALDRRRRVQPEQMDAEFANSLAAKSVPADRALDEARRMTAVLLAMEKLPKAERQVLLLAAVEELDTNAIAKVTERSESAVRALLFRARNRLRERLERRGQP